MVFKPLNINVFKQKNNKTFDVQTLCLQSSRQGRDIRDLFLSKKGKG